MRSLADLLDRVLDAVDDDPLVIAAGALVAILALVILAAVGLLLAAVVWWALPWSLIGLPLLCLGWSIADRGRRDP